MAEQPSAPIALAYHHCATILEQVVFASFEIINKKLIYFFIYDDLCRIESNN